MLFAAGGLLTLSSFGMSQVTIGLPTETPAARPTPAATGPGWVRCYAKEVLTRSGGRERYRDHYSPPSPLRFRLDRLSYPALQAEAARLYQAAGVTYRHVSCPTADSESELARQFSFLTSSGQFGVEHCSTNACTTRMQTAFPANWGLAVLPGPLKPGSGGRPATAAALPPPPPSPRDIAISAEVARLGAHRRAEAERIVEMRLAADAARGRSVGSALPSAARPAFVPRPPLPQTAPPRGFHDSNRFVTVSKPEDARAMFDRMSGTCGGKIEYLTSACYPDGSGGYSCQARTRCPLTENHRGSQQ